MSLLLAFDSNFQLNHTFAKVPTPRFSAKNDTFSDKKEAIILELSASGFVKLALLLFLMPTYLVHYKNVQQKHKPRVG